MARNAPGSSGAGINSQRRRVCALGGFLNPPIHTPLTGQDYALGWRVVERPWAGGTALTHNGTNTMNFAAVWLAPKRRFAVVAACNSGGKEADLGCDEAIALVIRCMLSEKKP